LNKEIMKRNRISTFMILTLSLGVLLIFIITQGSPILTTTASATTSATQEPTSSAANQTREDTQIGPSSSRLVTNATKTSANQTGEEDIQTGDIDLLDLATRKLTTPGVQSNPDEAIEKAKQQYR
jgi:hypothetical protein